MIITKLLDQGKEQKTNVTVTYYQTEAKEPS